MLDSWIGMVNDRYYLRFEPDDVGDPLAFVSLGVADLAHSVHEIDAQHPFINGELDFSSKVVDVLDQS